MKLLSKIVKGWKFRKNAVCTDCGKEFYCVPENRAQICDSCHAEAISIPYWLMELDPERETIGYNQGF